LFFGGFQFFHFKLEIFAKLCQMTCLCNCVFGTAVYSTINRTEACPLYRFVVKGEGLKSEAI